MNNAAELDDIAVLLRLHTGFKGLAREIGHGEPTEDLYVAASEPSRAGLFRKMLASLTAQLRGRGDSIGRWGVS